MRALILAGGGVKVGFQAGVLQVWLDEAGLKFDHADGASGGCFNLAMYCQGLTGRQIADNWRNLDPAAMVDVDEKALLELPLARSFATLDNLRRKVFPAWGVDFAKIRTGRPGTFNICNFSRKRIEVVTNDRLSEDFLVASVSLPMWFPPVHIEGETFVDSVYLTDANVEEAIRRGADEIWAIWTVSTRDVWDDGFVAQYFQTIEIAADGRFFEIWRRIERNNDAIAAGGSGEFGRTIRLKLLQAEVPIHYLLNLSKDRMNETVELGVETAREWCRKEGIPLTTPAPPPPAHGIALQFTETMKGRVARGEQDYQRGAERGEEIDFRLTIRTEDLDAFIRMPEHDAAAAGHLDFPALGQLTVEKGRFNLFVFDADPRHKKMLYRLLFRDAAGRPFTLSGFKEVNDDKGFDVWKDTTTLYTRIYLGHVTAEEEAAAELWGSGILTLGPLALLRQLATFRVEAPGLLARAKALERFGAFFLGSLWDVYAQRLLSYAPF
jgi:predicted acylesterase/phospholipase RssA